MGLICGRHHVLLFLLIPRTQPFNYLFSFLPFLFFLFHSFSQSPKTLQEGNFQVFLFIFVLGWARQPLPLFSGATESILQTVRLPVWPPQGWEPCSCPGTTPHSC